jgi:hypothetical protein
VYVCSVLPSINVLVPELSNLLNASTAEISLIEIYSKLSVPPWKLLAKIVPVPSPPAQPGVVLSVIGLGVEVGVGVAVGGTGVLVGVAVGGTSVAVGVGGISVAVGVGVGVSVDVGVGVGVGVDVGVGVGVG